MAIDLIVDWYMFHRRCLLREWLHFPSRSSAGL